MQMKRWIVVVVSLVIGALATGVIIYAPSFAIKLGTFSLPIPLGFGTNLHDFAYSNVILLFISLACIAGIWLDYFLDTKILKS
jgi:hypothetical protein